MTLKDRIFQISAWIQERAYLIILAIALVVGALVSIVAIRGCNSQPTVSDYDPNSVPDDRSQNIGQTDDNGFQQIPIENTDEPVTDDDEVPDGVDPDDIEGRIDVTPTPNDDTETHSRPFFNKEETDAPKPSNRIRLNRSDD